MTRSWKSWKRAHATALAIGASLAMALSSGAASAQDIAITNATVATGDGSEPIQNATVVVRDGKVVNVSQAGPPRGGMRVVDGTGKWVTPGIFAQFTDLGLWDVGAVSNSNDKSAGSSIFGAALDVAPAINPESQPLKVSRAGGVTRATVTSSTGGSIFGGQGAVIDLGADPNPITKRRAFQYVDLSENGASIAGGSRSASFVSLKNALAEARDLSRSSQRRTDALLTRADAAALVPVLNGKIPLYVRAERASDIRQVLSLGREYSGLKLVLVGANEGWTVAEEIARAKVPVIARALDDLPVTFQQLAATQSNIGRMTRAGVKVAIGIFDGHDQPRNATQFAGNLVSLQRVPGATGLSWGEALASITSIPAQIAGMSGKAGVLKPGAVGDVVIWDGDPLEVTSAPIAVYIEGVQQPLDNHQTRLRERYRDLDETQLPKAYSW